MKKFDVSAGTPLVIVHSGFSDYLVPVVGTCADTVGGARTVLIGNFDNDVFRSPVCSLRIEDLWGSLGNELLSKYSHMSLNNKNYELLCLLRWFAIREFMVKYGVESCIAIDSDTLVFDDLTGEFQDGDEERLVFPHQPLVEPWMKAISPHLCWIRSVKPLDDFCRFVVDTYSDPNRLARFRDHYDALLARDAGGGISDMAFFWFWSQDFPDKVRFTDPPSTTRKIWYDNAVWHAEGLFEVKDGAKVLDFSKGRVPTVDHPILGPIEVPTLQFQGLSKPLIGKFAGSYTNYVSPMKSLRRRIEWKVRRLLKRPTTPLG